MPMSSNMSHADIDQQRFGVSCQDGHERLVVVNGGQQVGKDLTLLNDALELLAQASLNDILSRVASPRRRRAISSNPGRTSRLPLWKRMRSTTAST